MEKKENQVQSDINTLIQLHEGLNNIPADVKNAEVESPIASVEKSLSQFVQDSFDVTRKDFEFNQAIQNEIVNRLPDMKNAELIALLTNNKVNDNDRVSKVLAPTFQLMTAKQQAEIAAMTAQAKIDAESGKMSGNPASSSSIKEMNENSSKELLQGITQLSNLLNFIGNASKANNEVIDTTAVEKK